MDDFDVILQTEQTYLDWCVGREDCYNIAKESSAPMAGRKHSQETIEKLRQVSINACTGKRLGEWIKEHWTGKKHTEETLAKLKKAALERDDSKRIAVIKSPEHRAKVSATLKGRKFSEETLKKRRETMQSEEYRRRRSESKKGIPFKDESKRKSSITKLGKQAKFFNILTNTVFEPYSIRSFCEQFKLDRHIVRSLMRGETPEYKNWKII